MTLLLSELFGTLVFTFIAVMPIWILVLRRRVSARPVENLARAFRAVTAASHTVDPSHYRRLSPEMITEVAAANGFRFESRQSPRNGGLLLVFSPAPAVPEGQGDD